MNTVVRRAETVPRGVADFGRVLVATFSPYLARLRGPAPTDRYDASVTFCTRPPPYSDAMTPRRAETALDWAMDKSLVLGYTRIGPALRRHWWPADPAADALAGSHVLVTGATGGLGLATAAGVARLGATVHLTGRDAGRLETAREELLRRVPGAAVHTDVADVSDLAATRDFAADFATRVPQLHALVHNAGVLPRRRTVTQEGHELALATHVLGPHVLTHGLADVLVGGRVVLVTSGGAYGQRLDADDPEYSVSAEDYSGVTAYARTKRMQIVLARCWATDLAGRGIAVAATHPGWASTPGITDSLPRFASLVRPLLRDAASGADTTVWLTATEEDLGSGGLWHDRRARPAHYAPVGVESEADVARFLAFVEQASGVGSVG